jgi:hypothetical protein
MLGSEEALEPLPGNGAEHKTFGVRIQKRVAILPATLSGVPIALALAGILRLDQIFFGLPFFLLIVAKAINQAPAIIHRINRRFIIAGSLGGYLLLQVIPFYNLQTNQPPFFIVKPDWRKASAYFLPKLTKKQTLIFENKHDLKSFYWYISQAKNRAQENIKNGPVKYRRPIINFPSKNIYETFIRDEYRSGVLIQSHNRGRLNTFLTDPLFSSYFTPVISFPSLKIYRYQLPILVLEDNHTRHSIRYNDLRVTHSQDLHRQVLFLETGDYLAAFQTEGDIPVQFSVSVDGGETVEVSSDSKGFGSFHIQAEQGLKELVFRLRKPDALQLKWFGIHRLQSDRIAFQAEDFQYTIPKTTSWIRKPQLGYRKTAGLYINSSVGYYFALAKGGRFQLALEGYNNRYGPIEVAVELDEKRIGIFPFDKLNGSWSRQYMPLTIPAGVHHIALSFINDLRNKDGDRNAFLDWFELNRIPDR